MIKTTIKIEGMMCGMCEAHVCDAIRKAVPYAKKVKASHIPHIIPSILIVVFIIIAPCSCSL